MSEYELLLDEAVQYGAYVLEHVNFESQSDGLINGDIIGLSNHLQNSAERACTLAEEIGHYKLNCGNILNQGDPQNRKQEKQARLWAYNRMITLDKLIAAWEAGKRNCYEIADYLDVTETFLQEAINIYKSKYDILTQRGNYIIKFDPLRIYTLK